MRESRSEALTIRFSSEQRAYLEDKARELRLTVRDYIHKRALTENESSSSKSQSQSSVPERSFKSLEFLEENYKDLSRMIMATQITVDAIASRFLKKETYMSVTKLHNKAFNIYDVTKDELKNKKQEGEDS